MTSVFSIQDVLHLLARSLVLSVVLPLLSEVALIDTDASSHKSLASVTTTTSAHEHELIMKDEALDAISMCAAIAMQATTATSPGRHNPKQHKYEYERFVLPLINCFSCARTTLHTSIQDTRKTHSCSTHTSTHMHDTLTRMHLRRSSPAPRESFSLAHATA